jgi:hypothetical protein
MSFQVAKSISSFLSLFYMPGNIKVCWVRRLLLQEVVVASVRAARPVPENEEAPEVPRVVRVVEVMSGSAVANVQEREDADREGGVVTRMCFNALGELHARVIPEDHGVAPEKERSHDSTKRIRDEVF